MSDRVWLSGPPPHVGWYETNNGCAILWRWWDGIAWSYGVTENSTAENAEFFSSLKVPFNPKISWSDYWPENARVPRIDPRESVDYKVEYFERMNFEFRLIKNRPWWKFWGKK